MRCIVDNTTHFYNRNKPKFLYTQKHHRAACLRRLHVWELESKVLAKCKYTTTLCES